MTVRELIRELEQCDQNWEVVVQISRDGSDQRIDGVLEIKGFESINEDVFDAVVLI